MKSVLLVSANQEKNPYPVAPLGLLYIAHALKHNGFKVSILDLCFSKDPRADIKNTITKQKPDFVGVSIRNVDNLTFPQSVSYLPAVKDTITTIKRHTRAPLVLGGSAFSLFPEKMLEFLDCNWGIVGEGEEAMAALLTHFEKKDVDHQNIENLIWRQGSLIRRNRVKYLNSCFDSILDYSFIDTHAYAKFAGMVNVQTKRGCRFKCSYCTYPAIEGKRYRLRSPETIAREMNLLHKKYGVPHIFFVDDVFTSPAVHAMKVCEALIKKGVTMRWSCFASPYGISKNLLMLMKKAGCTHIEFGSDALSKKVLAKLRKPFTVEDVVEASRLCKEVGIKCAHYIIFGAPGENQATLREGFTMIRKLKGDTVIAMLGIRIYPNTELEQVSLHEGIISKQTDLLFPHFYLSKELPVAKLLEQVSTFACDDPRCVVPGLGIRSSQKMYAILRKHYREGPLWGYLA